MKQEIDDQECFYLWKDVNINHEVETPSSGTAERDDTKTDNKGSGKSWENLFMKSNYIIAEGYFALHTYAYPKYLSAMLLILDSENSSNSVRVWKGAQSNEASVGSAQQTASVTLTLTASYDSEENITNMEIKSYIWAQTVVALHKCSVTSQINTIKFIIN